MNKTEFIAKVSDAAGLSKADAGRAVSAVLDTISTSLKTGGAVTFVGFGTFKTSDRKARTARNPRTGAPIEIAARRVPTFKAGSALKESVNDKAK